MLNEEKQWSTLEREGEHIGFVLIPWMTLVIQPSALMLVGFGCNQVKE